MTRRDYDRIAGVFANWTAGDHNTRWLLACGIADLMSKNWSVESLDYSTCYNVMFNLADI